MVMVWSLYTILMINVTVEWGLETLYNIVGAFDGFGLPTFHSMLALSYSNAQLLFFKPHKDSPCFRTPFLSMVIVRSEGRQSDRQSSELASSTVGLNGQPESSCEQ